VPGPLKPLIADSDNGGDRQRDDRREHLRPEPDAREDRHRQPAIEADAWHARSRQYADDAAEVAASSGLDILSHAIESFTAMPYTGRPMPDSPRMRPAYQGSNPISDVWSLQSLRMVAKYLVRAVADPSDEEARSQMLLAGSVRGRRVRQRRRAPAARHVVPGVRQRKELSRARIFGRSSARAARHLGDPECAGGVSGSPRRRIRIDTSKRPERSGRRWPV
jgi:hypothetical protein